jgi:hypothetical protein
MPTNKNPLKNPRTSQVGNSRGRSASLDSTDTNTSSASTGTTGETLTSVSSVDYDEIYPNKNNLFQDENPNREIPNREINVSYNIVYENKENFENKNPLEISSFDKTLTKLFKQWIELEHPEIKIQDAIKDLLPGHKLPSDFNKPEQIVKMLNLLKRNLLKEGNVLLSQPDSEEKSKNITQLLLSYIKLYERLNNKLDIIREISHANNVNDPEKFDGIYPNEKPFSEDSPLEKRTPEQKLLTWKKHLESLTDGEISKLAQKEKLPKLK